jgi:hypothetical protein
MKRSIVFALLLSALFCSPGKLGAQVRLESIDSLYMQSLDSFYSKARMYKDEVWEGMQLAPVCLFRDNGPAFLYNHPDPPASMARLSKKLYVGEQKDLNLFGATQAEINGELTAVVDYGMPGYLSVDEVWAVLFHELHHVYQRKHVSHLKYDNPAVLLTYPEDCRNDAIKLYEQRLLLEMCHEQDPERFRDLVDQFYSCRLVRENVIGDYITYDIAVENFEGPAFYSEYVYYDIISGISEPLKDNFIQSHFFNILNKPYFGRKNLRERHLASGLAMSLILSNFFEGWQSEYYQDSLSLYDFFISRFGPEKVNLNIDSSYFRMSSFYTGLAVENHRKSMERFHDQSGVRLVLKFKSFPQFRGLDPMNAEAVDDSTILHSTLLSLVGGADNKLFMTNRKALTIYEDDIWFVNKVVVILPRNKVEIKDDLIVISGKGLNLFWKGEVVADDNEEVFFVCE